MNRFQIVGRLGRKPELRKTKSGTEVCNLSVATDAYNGDTDWHRIAVFGKQAVNCAKYLDKGQYVAVTGDLRYQKREIDGRTWSLPDLVAQRVEFMGRSGGSNSSSRDASPDDQFGPGADISPDDVPF